MKKVKIVDRMFAHAKYSTDFQESKYIEWDRTPLSNNDNVIFYTDYSLNEARNKEKSIGWLLESPQITKQSYSWILNNNNNFTKVLTHNRKLLEMGENFHFSPTGGCWIKPDEQKVYEKTKLISMISSNKNLTNGHLVRYEIISNNSHQFDLYGRGFNPIKYKIEGLKDYAFSVTVENTNEDYYFSEKLIDCFRTGTVPVYWGCPSIGDFFDLEGMIIINSALELDKIINELTMDKYNSMLPAIHRNFDKAQKFIIAEDYIYENYLKNDE